MTSKTEWDQLAVRLDAEDDYRVLRRVPEVNRYAAAADDGGVPPRLGLIVDVETTGLDPDHHKIIELAMLPFHFSPAGTIYDVLPGYAGFEDPGEPIPSDIVDLTGITDAKVRGQTLDESAVTNLVGSCSLVIAHNAGFDRRFLERRFPLFIDTPWACSFSQLPWSEEGLASRKLDYILGHLGFFFDDHRALADCQAVLHLLSLDLPKSGRPIFQTLLETARQPSIRLWAVDAPFDAKDILKARGYAWNPGDDGRPRAWFVDVDEEALEDERGFLFEKVYAGDPRFQESRIDYNNRFSDRR
ncbi:MAG: 3'-5' exonuclease [Geminicoccaceae bacterium]